MKHLLALSLLMTIGCDVHNDREAPTTQEPTTKETPHPTTKKALPPREISQREDFEQPNPYTLGGSRGQRLMRDSTGGFLRLAFSGTTSQENTIAFERVATGAPEQVAVEFDFRLQAGSGCAADGIGFALLHTTEFGVSGEAPVFAEEPNLKGSFGVGFDLYDNGETLGANHLSLHMNGALIENVAPQFPLLNGVFNHAKIVLAAAPGGFTVDVTLTPGGGAPVKAVSGLLVGSPLYESRVAFGGRVGACAADQDIDNVSVRYTSSAIKE